MGSYKMDFDLSDIEYEVPRSPKTGCRKHCPINRGPCTFYNPITHYCRTHCTSECLLETPRSCYIEGQFERPKSHISLMSSGRTSRRSESRHRRRSSRTPSHSSRSSHRSKENETYRNYSKYNSNTPNRVQQKRKGPDELEIVLYILFAIWLFLITSALLQ